jgi:hypothetical protein
MNRHSRAAKGKSKKAKGKKVETAKKRGLHQTLMKAALF